MKQSGMKQSSIVVESMRKPRRVTRREELLGQLEAVLPWGELLALLRPYYYGGELSDGVLSAAAGGGAVAASDESAVGAGGVAGASAAAGGDVVGGATAGGDALSWSVSELRRRRGGRPALELELMLRVYLLQLVFSMSDLGVEEYVA